MPLLATIGQSQLLDGHAAGSEAARNALDRLGRGPATFGFVIVSLDYPIGEVVNGISTMLGDTPLMGFSTSGTLTGGGQSRRSVVVGLLSSSDVQARADWWSVSSEGNGPAEGIRESADKMLQSLQPWATPGTLLVVYDGLASDAGRLVEAIQTSIKSDVENSQPGILITGWLSEGDLRHENTYQIGGRQGGTGGVAAALLSGKITAGVGAATGWNQAGPYFKVTRVNRTGATIVHGLDGQPASDFYAQLLGYSSKDWTLPPLNELVRLYPLGIESRVKTGPEKTIRIRSPLRFDSDGGLRMNASIREKNTAHLLIGSVDSCLQAAEDAARQALDALAHSHLAHTDLAHTALGQYGLAQRQSQGQPALAVVLVDKAWQMLMEACPGEEVKAIQKIIGKDVPLIGGYTYGQFAPLAGGTEVELLNQHLLLILFGETNQ
jgi:hypothetical protein